MNKKVQWDVKARFYVCFRRIFPFSVFLNRENDALKSLLEEIHVKKGIAVDLGTGTGNALSFIPTDFIKIGLDLNFKMLKFAKKRISGYYIQSDILNAAIRHNSADIVTMCGVWEYIKDRYPLLHELNRIMKQNGYAIITYSPPKLLTSFRILFGLKIYPMTDERMREYLNVNGFEIMALRRCVLQHQILIIKSEANGTSQI